MQAVIGSLNNASASDTRVTNDPSPEADLPDDPSPDAAFPIKEEEVDLADGTLYLDDKSYWTKSEDLEVKLEDDGESATGPRCAPFAMDLSLQCSDVTLQPRVRLRLRPE